MARTGPAGWCPRTPTPPAPAGFGSADGRESRPMLLVKCRLLPSPIHGIGLFAAEPIRKGTRVWELTPGFDLVLRKKDFKGWPPRLRKFLDNYGFRYQKGVYILSSDHAKHFN